MSAPNTPTIGAIGLCRIAGNVGKAIKVAQWLDGNGWDNYQHAMICVQVDTAGGRALAVQAEPGGATLHWYTPADGIRWSQLPLSWIERRRITKTARKYVGTGYSFLDYLALAAHRIHLPLPFLRDYIASTGHQICSQLVDTVYSECGIHLFTDNRWPGYVTPAMLDTRLFGRKDT